MLSLVIEDIGTEVLASVSAAQDGADSAGVPPVRTLRRNEILFEAGDLKTHLYRVEAGVICLYVTRLDKERQIVEFALAGDLVGMGFLERHATSARAVVDSKVSCLGLDEIERLTAEDARAKARFDDAVEREFALRRDYISDMGVSRPLVQLASFLIAVVRQNENEGRDASVIDDTLECAVVAGYLGISVGQLAELLVELEARGLIEPAANHGMRIVDMERLEALSDEIADPLLQSDLPNSQVQRLLPAAACPRAE